MFLRSCSAHLIDSKTWGSLLNQEGWNSAGSSSPVLGFRIRITTPSFALGCVCVWWGSRVKGSFSYFQNYLCSPLTHLLMGVICEEKHMIKDCDVRPECFEFLELSVLTSRMVQIFHEQHVERHWNMYTEAKSTEKLLKAVLNYFRWWYHECYDLGQVCLLVLKL